MAPPRDNDARRDAAATFERYRTRFPPAVSFVRRAVAFGTPMQPTISVVIPVYNRDAALRRALHSIQDQTFRDFECIVVDDASTTPIPPIIDSLQDDRFRYARNDRNGGPYNARARGYRMMRGEFLVSLDSDDEAYPWLLGQAVRYLREVPEADGVAGMNVRGGGGALVQVRGGRKLVSPSEYATLPALPDCVGAVRRLVVDEWLQKRDDYFAFEVHQWFTFHMHHSMLFVDEPWVRIHTGCADRVSPQVTNRQLDDYLKFLDEHLAYVERVPSVVLDHLLEDAWFQLRRAGRKEDAERVAVHLDARGLSKRGAMARRLAGKARRSLLRREPTHYLD
jgi:glycosyltransferase involved in cell wall biosynthesis